MSSSDGVGRNLSSLTWLGQGYRTGIQTTGEAQGWEQSSVAEGAGAQGEKGEGPALASRQPWQRGAGDCGGTERLTRSFCFP